METYFRFLQTFSSFVLDIDMPLKNHAHNKFLGCFLWKKKIHSSQQNNNHGIEFGPFIFYISNDLKSYLSNKFVKLVAKACPIIFVASNNPIATCFNCKSPQIFF